MDQHVVATILFQYPSDASDDEIAYSESTRIDVGVSDTLISTMLTWRLKDDRASFVVDTPFHIGLEVEGARQLPIVDNSINLVVVVQNHAGVCMNMRLGMLRPRVTSYLTKAVKRQISDAERPGFEMRHWAAVKAWNDKFKTPAAGHRQALLKERVL